MGEEFKNGPEEGSGSSSVRADCHARYWLEWRENSVSLVKVAFFFTLVISKILFLVSGIKLVPQGLVIVEESHARIAQVTTEQGSFRMKVVCYGLPAILFRTRH